MTLPSKQKTLPEYFAEQQARDERLLTAVEALTATIGKQQAVFDGISAALKTLGDKQDALAKRVPELPAELQKQLASIADGQKAVVDAQTIIRSGIAELGKRTEILPTVRTDIDNLISKAKPAEAVSLKPVLDSIECLGQKLATPQVLNLPSIEDKLDALLSRASTGGVGAPAELLSAVNEVREALGLEPVALDTGAVAPAQSAQMAALAPQPAAEPPASPPAQDPYGQLEAGTQALLSEAGYTDTASVAAAPDSALLAIKGIAKTKLAEIRALIPAQGSDQ